MAAPLQYPLCCQTVTFYHADPAAHTITRTVVQGVHFDTRRRETAAGGSGPAGSAATAFLLVIPEKVPGLAAVQYVDCKTAAGQAAHVEAGGWWTRSGSGAHSLSN